MVTGRVENPDGTLTCQATEIARASCPIELGSPGRYLLDTARDFGSGRIGIGHLRRLAVYLRGKLLLLLFTRWAKTPWNAGRYRKTPSRRLDLKPGEMVEVRSAREILRTLDRRGRNRGMAFKAEMFSFCGRRFRVVSRMERRVDERDGLLHDFSNECIILDSVHCEGQRSFCSRHNYHYWREIWLNRVDS
jgi:hypothetical protein